MKHLEIPQEIDNYDFPDTIRIPDGWDSQKVPDLTRRNMEFLAKKYNELIEYLNKKEEK